jgi:dUTP pyrophosphatase
LINIGIQLLAGNEDLPLPKKMSKGASGFDLFAAVKEPQTILPGKWKLIPTGIALSMPEGYEAQVRPRSGLALKNGITVLNAPGTIDADYRGEIGVILLNLADQEYVVHRGERIAQLVFQRIPDVEFQLMTQLDQTKRGSGGFGHTGR